MVIWLVRTLTFGLKGRKSQILLQPSYFSQIRETYFRFKDLILSPHVIDPLLHQPRNENSLPGAFLRELYSWLKTIVFKTCHDHCKIRHDRTSSLLPWKNGPCFLHIHTSPSTEHMGDFSQPYTEASTLCTVVTHCQELYNFKGSNFVTFSLHW